MNALLIAGTETGVGKTVLTLALAAYWQRYGKLDRLGIMKPVQCGDRSAFGVSGGDRALYQQLFSLNQSLEQITPLYFQSTLVPPLAAAQEGQRIRLDVLWQQFDQLLQTRDLVLVEAWGGLGSPLTRETTVADLAWDWRIPTVLVVPVQSETIAQVVANVALAQQSRLHLKGIVLNCSQPCTPEQIETWADPALIQSLTNKPVLGCIPHLADPADCEKLAQVAASLELERLLPSPECLVG
ncbi:MAG TPA: dethiobiotin synthase [Allocoleopsis sp.]